MNSEKKIKVGISIGDINGIGIEIFLKTFRKKGLVEFFTPILFGSTNICSYYQQKFNIDIKLHSIHNMNNIIHNKINVMNLWQEEIQIEPGIPTYYSKLCALESLQFAVKSLKNQLIDVLVTCPINKKLMFSNEFPFLGHTNYIENFFQEKSLMIMIYEKLKIALLTGHISIKNIINFISKENIKKYINLFTKSLRQDFAIIKPKIAVLGLNPHAGDGGILGDEEDNIITPVIDELYKKGLLIFGPYSADSFFRNSNYLSFDGILALYHDQGLIPFKILSSYQGVNFTAGLSYIRTSPDHGVAYNIAGKGIANESSFQEAIFQAIKIYQYRRKYFESTK